MTEQKNGQDLYQEHLRSLRWPALVALEREYDDLIYGENSCFGTSDLIRHHLIQVEMGRREAASD